MLKSSSPTGSSGELSGTRYEFVKLALDYDAMMFNMTFVAERFAEAQVRPNIADGLLPGSLTALQKDDGGIRGTVAGEAFRRLFSKSLAIADDFKSACLPYQFGLSTGAGIDCVAHLLRAIAGVDPSKNLIAINGVGAFDHIKRSSMLGKRLSQAKKILPYCRMTYNRQSRYVWYDADGRAHNISQGDGGGTMRSIDASSLVTWSSWRPRSYTGDTGRRGTIVRVPGRYIYIYIYIA